MRKKGKCKKCGGHKLSLLPSENVAKCQECNNLFVYKKSLDYKTYINKSSFIIK